MRIVCMNPDRSHRGEPYRVAKNCPIASVFAKCIKRNYTSIISFHFSFSLFLSLFLYEYALLIVFFPSRYDPTLNAFVIPPGILQPPIYEGTGARNAAKIGTVIGHEIGHSIDNQGRYFDEFGSWLPDGWWSADDEREFGRRTDCLAKDYGHPCGYEAYGEHTLGEDMADQTGVRAAHAALKAWRGVDFTALDEEEFFRDYARVWCARRTNAKRCDRVYNDVHALPKHRVNKTLRQLKEFSRAFFCRSADRMVNAQRCLVY